MKQSEPNEDDDLRPEYDLKSLQVRRLGADRKAFGKKSDLKEYQDREYSSDDQSGDTSDESEILGNYWK